jgi:hypothetical protein
MDDTTVTNEIAETDCASLTIVEGVNFLIYLCDSNLEDGHQQSTINATIIIQVHVPTHIDHLDIEVMSTVYTCVLAINSASKSTRIILSSYREVYIVAEIPDQEIELKILWEANKMEIGFQEA